MQAGIGAGAKGFAQTFQFRFTHQRLASGAIDLHQHPVARTGLEHEIVLAHRGNESDAAGRQRVAATIDVKMPCHLSEQHQLDGIVEMHEGFGTRGPGTLRYMLDMQRRFRRQFHRLADGAIEMG